MNLTQTDISALSSALRELYSHTDAETLPHCVIKLLGQLIAADNTSYNLLDFQEKKAIIIHNGPTELEVHLPAFDALLHEHPLVQHQHLRGQWRMGAAQISDFLSQRQFRDTAIYQEFFRPIGSEDQLGMYVEEQNRGALTVCFNAGRPGTFTERDREILTFLQPHLIQAFKNAADITLAKARTTDMRNIAEAAHIGVVWLNRDEEVEYMSSAIQLWLKLYFPSTCSGSHSLPPPLLRWIRRQKAARMQDTASGWQLETTLLGTRGELKIRWILEDEDRSYLLISEERLDHNPDDLRPLGLSRRETEVLHWIAEGNSNAAIATILGISKRTVDKHVENILRKLHVETRVEAAIHATQLRV